MLWCFVIVFSGVTSAQIEQNVEPTTRVQFLQCEFILCPRLTVHLSLLVTTTAFLKSFFNLFLFLFMVSDACELTLDPTTAHDNLVVSTGGKAVKFSPQINKSIRYPERFLHRCQVLCREGLQAERCYYEIEVEGDKAEIALAYKRIDRKSRTNLSAFGGNANSWSLDRSRDYSVSHNSDSIRLTASPSHHRIGVYLKFKEGTLSFYEVSDSMKFLYKVEAKFTESLYPGFWLGEKCCIRICDLRQEEPKTASEIQRQTLWSKI